MSIEIREESPRALAEYGDVPIAFRVESRFRVDLVNGGLGGTRLIEERVDTVSYHCRGCGSFVRSEEKVAKPGHVE